ncbi:MAG: hypothetical protein IKG56_03190 [Clostridia bacterium]|nr:hypothetical protein [Clostridia bacterium]
MFKLDGKYGCVNIKGRSIDIEKAEINDLNNYIIELESKRIQLIEQQNYLLTQIIR